MQNNPSAPAQQATPIHLTTNRRGTLRKIERSRPKKALLSPEHPGYSPDALMLNLLHPLHNNSQTGPAATFREMQKEMMFQRVSVLSSIRCRNLRNKYNEERKRDRSLAWQQGELRLEPCKEEADDKICLQGKNKSLYNIFVCRRTAPLPYSRSKTAREHYTPQSKNIELPSQTNRAVVGYQISPHSPMNRKRSIRID